MWSVSIFYISMLPKVATVAFPCPEYQKLKPRRRDLCSRGCFSSDKLALHAAHTQTYTRSQTLHKHSITDRTVHMLHSLWPDPLRSLALSSHSYTVFPIFRFLPLLSVFLVSPQLGKRLHRGGLIGFASWVGCFFVSLRERRGSGGVGQLVGAKNPRWRDQCLRLPPHAFFGGGANLMISSSEGWRMMSFWGRVGKDRNVIFEDTKRQEE